MERLTCSVSDAAQSLGVDRSTIYNWIPAGRIEAVKIGGRRLIKIESVKRLVQAA